MIILFFVALRGGFYKNISLFSSGSKDLSRGRARMDAGRQKKILDLSKPLEGGDEVPVYSHEGCITIPGEDKKISCSVVNPSSSKIQSN